MIRKKQNIIEKYLKHPYLLSLVGLVLIILMSWPLVRNIKKHASINSEINSLESEIADLESRNSDLKGLIDYFRSDEFVEEQARLSLNYRQPQEEVLVIKDEALTTRQSDKPSYNIPGKEFQDTQKKETNASKWFRYFFE